MLQNLWLIRFWVINFHWWLIKSIFLDKLLLQWLSFYLWIWIQNFWMQFQQRNLWIFYKVLHHTMWPWSWCIIHKHTFRSWIYFDHIIRVCCWHQLLLQIVQIRFSSKSWLPSWVISFCFLNRYRNPSQLVRWYRFSDCEQWVSWFWQS